MLEHEEIGGVMLVVIRSELDAGSASRVKEYLDGLTGGGATRLVVDLSSLDFIDSAGLGVLVATLKVLRARGGDLRLCGLRDSVRMIFDLTRLSKVFKIFPGREEAVSSFAGGGIATGVEGA